MKRTDNLQENQLVARVTSLRQTFDEMKNAQRAGSQNVQVKRVVTGNSLDFTVTATYHVINIFEATLTFTDASFANGNFVWRSFWNVLTQSGSGTAQAYAEVLPAETGKRRFRFYIMGMSPSATVTYGVRFVVYAIASGTISVSQIQ